MAEEPITPYVFEELPVSPEPPKVKEFQTPQGIPIVVETHNAPEEL